MKKYRFINSEESFEMGEHVNLQVLVDENLVKQLLEAGAIEEISKLTMEDIVEHLDGRIDCDVEVFLTNLEKASKKALFTLLAKEAAMVLDAKYDGHIKYANELWGISRVTYYPINLTSDPKAIIHTDFTKLAAFRSKEDAEEAIEVLKPIIDELR